MVTGIQAAGKSTVGPLLAARLGTPAAAFDGDVFFRTIVAGRAEMTPDPDPEAVRQLRLRYEASALVARHYTDAGFDFVYSDIIMGDDIAWWMDSPKNVERHLVVLNPSVDAIVQRELGRDKSSYRNWHKPDESLADGVIALRAHLLATPRRGLWLDTSNQSAEETVTVILANLEASRY